jgi:chloramphenicol 3-O-phosphotransferase
MMVGGVAVPELGAGGLGEFVMAGMVRATDDELDVGGEVALDAVEVAGWVGVATKCTLLAAAQARIAGVQWADRLSMTRKIPTWRG